MSEIGILIIDDDVTSQRALKSILDSEGWGVRIAAEARQALAELASGNWNLAIVNVALLDMRGPLFAILRELAQAQPVPNADGEEGAPPRKMIRVLFLLPPPADPNIQAILEREELPYALKPCHLHDFLEKVSELLVEGGAITEPLRSIRGFGERKKRRHRDSTFSHDSGRGAMFASREDYQMTEEELAEFERQEEIDRKKREKKHNGNGSY